MPTSLFSFNIRFCLYFFAAILAAYATIYLLHVVCHTTIRLLFYADLAADYAFRAMPLLMPPMLPPPLPLCLRRFRCRLLSADATAPPMFSPPLMPPLLCHAMLLPC